MFPAGNIIDIGTRFALLPTKCTERGLHDVLLHGWSWIWLGEFFKTSWRSKRGFKVTKIGKVLFPGISEPSWNHVDHQARVSAKCSSRPPPSMEARGV